MSRVQLALNVSNLESAIDFYTKLFKAQPAKVRPGYANFALDEPPLKLVLIEGGGVPGSVNHLGVEVSSMKGHEATARLERSGPGDRGGSADNVLLRRPGQSLGRRPRWLSLEVYTVLADVEDKDASCCAPAADDLHSCASDACC